MKIVTPGQMREMDRLAIEQYGIPGIVLMENAAVKVVDEVVKLLGEPAGKGILIFAGKGNNGGDAFAAARHLYNRNAAVEVFMAAGTEEIAGDAKTNLDILLNMGVGIKKLPEDLGPEELKIRLRAADLIIDGIFGTGFKGEITGVVREILEAVNQSGKKVVSIDIPSGVNGQTGEAAGACIKASKTVTFHLPKIGTVVHPGCEYTGELVAVDIGIPGKVAESLGIDTYLTDENMIAERLPQRKAQSNKGDYGKILIISGSTGMTGAGSLSARAALRTGAGLVYLGVPASLTAVYGTLSAESVTLPLEDKGSGHVTKKSIRQIKEKLAKMDAAVIGPGLSVNSDIVEVVSGLIESSEVPLVLDADALNAVAQEVSVLQNLKADTVITPHPGEMARLTGLSIEEIQKNRIAAAKEFAQKWRVITVLKGARSIIALPDGTIFINPTGNSGMATAGTGDVLTGIIASLIGQGLKASDAAVAGVYLHGLAGDAAAAVKGEHGLIAGDVVEAIPATFKKLITGRCFYGL